jgi:hypothetical protein
MCNLDIFKTLKINKTVLVRFTVLKLVLSTGYIQLKEVFVAEMSCLLFICEYIYLRDSNAQLCYLTTLLIKVTTVGDKYGGLVR